MIRRLTLVFAIVGLALAVATAANALGVPDIVSQVSQTSYRNYLDNQLYTHTGDNRGAAGAQHDLARANIYSNFQSFGLTTYYDPFIYNHTTYNNVVGVLPGTTRPNDFYIVGAHYDSANNPGADDNASGTAGVIEAARVLSQYDFEASLIFIGFDLEESGLIGSNAYAQAHSSNNILGMISLDMIAYNGGGTNQALIYGRTASDPLKQSLANSIALYGNGITSTLQGQLDASDHAPFEWVGFQAALLIEGGVWGNPYYHQAGDTVDTPNYIDYAYASNMTRATVGYLAASAGLVPEPGSLIPLGTGLIWLVAVFRRRAC